jgi:hypothetical protein
VIVVVLSYLGYRLGGVGAMPTVSA